MKSEWRDIPLVIGCVRVPGGTLYQCFGTRTPCRRTDLLPLFISGVNTNT